MPTLEVNNFNIVVSVLGAWVSLFGLVSYLLKENFYISEALISLLAGVAVGPNAANWIRPLDYANGSSADLGTITLYFSRLVLGVQLVLAGVQLPSRYLRHEWKPLLLLVGPIMTCMWLATASLIYCLIPRIPFVHALAIGACVTPTDPVLSAVIVKGKFADHNVPTQLQQIIVAESGANDGLGYPFLFLPLYLIKYTSSSSTESGGAAKAMSMWFGETLLYTILLSVVYGAAVGWAAKRALYWAESRRYVDRESFLVFAISLALFIVGTCGMIGSDDVLACFIAGNVFTWDDWFRRETQDDSLQPTIDMLLNVTIFMYYGSVCPWSQFLYNTIIPLWRLIPLGILVLLLRRLPWVFAVHKLIRQIEEIKQALFVGFFGPIGVSAIFYLYIAINFVDSLQVGGEIREDVKDLSETTLVVVWFLVICSVVIHGISIPLGKLGYYLPQTLTAWPNSPDEPQSLFRHRVQSFFTRRSTPQSTSRPNTPTHSLRIVALPTFQRSSKQPSHLGSPSENEVAHSAPMEQTRVENLDGTVRFMALGTDATASPGQTSTPVRNRAPSSTNVSKKTNTAASELAPLSLTTERGRRLSGGRGSLEGGYGTVAREEV